MTCKIHPLDSVRLTLNCDAGTLALEVNGADQGVVFANIPPDVHPAVCFYGITKSVRLVELKRICGDSDSDASDSEDESDAEVSPAPAGAAVETVPLSQHVAGQATTSTASGPEIPDLNDTDIFSDTAEDADGRKGSRVDGVGNVQHRSRVEASTSRRGARREEEAVAFTIRAAIVDSPSAGLLASLANFAQWYVPRGQEDGGGDQHVASAQRADIEEVERERMVRTQDPYERLIHTVGRMCPGKQCILSFYRPATHAGLQVGLTASSRCTHYLCSQFSVVARIMYLQQSSVQFPPTNNFAVCARLTCVFVTSHSSYTRCG